VVGLIYNQSRSAAGLPHMLYSYPPRTTSFKCSGSLAQSDQFVPNKMYCMISMASASRRVMSTVLVVWSVNESVSSKSEAGPL
jgi:hypothetical protein